MVVVVLAVVLRDISPARLPTCNADLVAGFFFSSRGRHTRFDCDWSSDVCSSDLRRDRALDGAQSPDRSVLVAPLQRAARRVRRGAPETQGPPPPRPRGDPAPGGGRRPRGGPPLPGGGVPRGGPPPRPNSGCARPPRRP